MPNRNSTFGERLLIGRGRVVLEMLGRSFGNNILTGNVCLLHIRVFVPEGWDDIAVEVLVKTIAPFSKCASVVRLYDRPSAIT